MIRLAIAEDHQSLIDGIKLLLEYEDDISIVGTSNNGEALLEIVEKKQPNVVLTDIRMPKMDGIEATKLIKKNHPDINVLAFTMFEQTEAIEQMLAAGAIGYILKNSSLDEVHKAILTVHKGETYFDANINTNVLNASTNNKTKGVLTKRQLEILQLIAQGKPLVKSLIRFLLAFILWIHIVKIWRVFWDFKVKANCCGMLWKKSMSFEIYLVFGIILL